MSVNRFLLLTVTITLLGLVASIIWDFPFFLGFLFGFVTCLVGLNKLGFPLKKLYHASFTGMKKTKEVLFILLLIGALIPAWMMSATIPVLILGALQFISVKFFLLTAFLISAGMSMLLGTSVGTLSTIGLPLMGMAYGVDIPLGLAAGALVSGAMVGDRSSPFSSAFQLLANVTEVNPREQFRALLPSLLFGLIFTAATFFFIDMLSFNRTLVVEKVYIQTLGDFVEQPWLSLIPVIVMLFLLFFRIPVKRVFMINIFMSIPIAIWIQQISWDAWITSLWQGYSMIPSLTSGGVAGMIPLVVFIALAGGFSGMLEESQILTDKIRKVLGDTPTLWGYTWRTMVFGGGITLLAGNQTLPIMMVGRNLRNPWETYFAKQLLARVIADSAVVFAALIPWNMLAILSAAVLGVKVLDYLPFAFFLWSLPFFTLTVFYIRTYISRKKEATSL